MAKPLPSVLRQFPSLFQAAPDETDRPHFSLRTKQRGADEFLRKQRQRLRLSDFFRPTWEDLVGLRVISVNLISLAGPNAQKFHLLVHLFGNGL